MTVFNIIFSFFSRGGFLQGHIYYLARIICLTVIEKRITKKPMERHNTEDICDNSRFMISVLIANLL